jgi:hypothetical protein
VPSLSTALEFSVLFFSHFRQWMAKISPTLPNPLKYSSHSKTKESDPGQLECKNIWWGDLLGVDGGLNMPLLVGIGIFNLPKIGGDRFSSLYTFRRPCKSRVTHTAHTSQNRVNLSIEFEVSYDREINFICFLFQCIISLRRLNCFWNLCIDADALI